MKYTVFNDILNQISNQKIKDFTIACLKDAPEEIDTIAASKSGKYHPEMACKEGGLVWHIQRTCWFANQFMQAYQWKEDDIKGDIVLSALLLHDIGKRKEYKNYFEYVDHPKTASKMIARNKNMVNEKVFKMIQGAVLNHMGPFGGKFWKKELSKYNIIELVVYNSDYLASRKDIKIGGEK